MTCLLRRCVAWSWTSTAPEPDRWSPALHNDAGREARSTATVNQLSESPPKPTTCLQGTPDSQSACEAGLRVGSVRIVNNPSDHNLESESVTDSELSRQIQEALDSEDSILSACRHYLETISPTVAAICDEVGFDGFKRELIYRCIVRRTQENFAMIVSTAVTDFSYMSTMPLRPLCEDLIYSCWLRTLPEGEADKVVEWSMTADISKSIDAQNEFLTSAYADLDISKDGSGPRFTPPAGNFDVIRMMSDKEGLKNLGLRLGWPKGRQPSIRDMASACGLSGIYEFFYHGASKAVHSNLHNMARMVWGSPETFYSISSRNFEKYYAGFGLVYGMWLTEEIINRLVQPEFPAEFDLMHDEARSIWLAMVLRGLARNEALPQLVTKQELRGLRSE